MTRNWEIKKLGDICTFENGDRGKNYPSRSKYTDKGIPIINAGNLSDNGIKKEELNYISKDQFNLLSQGKFRKGDILFCLRGSLGKFSLVEILDEGAIASSLVIVRASGAILKEFLAAYFRSSLCSEMIDKYSNGAAQPNLSAQSLKSFEIPLPPLPEQKRIVKILDQAFAAIDQAKANAEKNLQNSRELFDAYLNKVFANPGGGWEEKELEKVSTIINGYSFKSNDFSNRNEIKSIKITNVGIRKFIENTDSNLPRVYWDSHKNFIVNAGDIVIALTRTIISDGLKVAIIPSTFDKALLNQRVAAIKPKTHVLLNKFLFAFLSTHIVKKYVTSKANTLMQPNLSISDLKKLKLPLPDVMTQKLIVERLDKISLRSKKLETIYQLKLKNLEELKKSILQKAFNGQLKSDN